MATATWQSEEGFVVVVVAFRIHITQLKIKK